MNISRPSLVDFESYRKSIEYIPPAGSNSFYEIGEGEINIFCIRDDPLDLYFRLFTHRGSVPTGNGVVHISTEYYYKDLTIIENTELVVNSGLVLSNGKMDVHGKVSFDKSSKMRVADNSKVIFYSDSVFDIMDNPYIDIDETSYVCVYGTINIHLNKISLLSNRNLIIDSAAIINVFGIYLGQRTVSLTEYERLLRDTVININTQGEYNNEYCRIGYNWVGGTPATKSQIIKMIVLWGESVLGDFKLSILGLQEREIPNKQVISDLEIKKGCTLYISESFKEFQFLHPELYLGVILGNTKRPATCTIYGTIIADGNNSIITIDRGASIYIKDGGELYLRNGAEIRSTNNSENDKLILIDGTLIIDEIEQINSFTTGNIVFGEHGKVKILNPDTGERKLLFTTPIGIASSDLYRLFYDNIDHIEYHVSNNTGIGIDKYFEFYQREMTKWFGDRRIEKAIHDGILVWHDGGFIEIYKKVTPWANTNCTLLEASRLFKSFGSYDNERLQEVVERLIYAGCGNIVFRFIDGDDYSEVTLTLDKVKMNNVINKPMTDSYILYHENDGDLYIQNKVNKVDSKHIISPKSKNVKLIGDKTEFQLS
ncbi:MAG: hypothetical protein NC131_13560 [Roseburia sp.]|nr:hypothetical protein [Roseburia sp.]